jgi:hypothetical protein
MKCIFCNEETSGSIGGKNICPECDCGIDIEMNWKTGKLEKITNYQRKWDLLKEWLNKEHVNDSNVDAVLRKMAELERNGSS